jgi:ABC-2 type transport system permease protein
MLKLLQIIVRNSRFRNLSILAYTVMKLDLSLGFQFFARYVWIIFFCLIYRFLFQTVYVNKMIAIDTATLNFATFLISGTSLVRMVPTASNIFQDTYNGFSRAGMKEWVFLSPSGWKGVALAAAAWRTLVVFSEFAAGIFFGHLLIGTPLLPFLHWSILTAVFFTAMAYAGLGLLFSSTQFVFRKGVEFLPILHQLSFAFGGVFFPISMFPPVVQKLAHLLPITFSLKYIRLCLAGVPWENGAGGLFSVVLLGAALLSAGIFSLSRAINWSRRNGII